MKVNSAITYTLLVLLSVANAVYIPITDNALQEHQTKSARQKLDKSGIRRSRPNPRIVAGSAISFSALFKHLETAHKAADKRRRQLITFTKMLEITNGYKNWFLRNCQQRVFVIYRVLAISRHIARRDIFTPRTRKYRDKPVKFNFWNKPQNKLKLAVLRKFDH